MSVTKPSFTAGASLSDFTITLNSLADGAAKESTKVDFSSTPYLDAQVRLAITLAAGVPTADTGRIDVYAYASLDGTNFTDNATGVNATVTMRSRPNLFYVTTIQTSANLLAAAPWHCVIPSIAMAFGGVLPPYWGLVIVNNTGLAFHSSGNAAKYGGLNAQTV